MFPSASGQIPCSSLFRARRRSCTTYSPPNASRSPSDPPPHFPPPSPLTVTPAIIPTQRAPEMRSHPAVAFAASDDGALFNPGGMSAGAAADGEEGARWLQIQHDFTKEKASVEPWSLLRQPEAMQQAAMPMLVLDLLPLLWWRVRDKRLWHGWTKEGRLEKNVLSCPAHGGSFASCLPC